MKLISICSTDIPKLPDRSIQCNAKMIPILLALTISS